MTKLLSNRRTFLQCALGGMTLSAGFASRAFAQGAAEVMPLGDNLYLIRVPGEAAVVVHTDSDGVLLVDGGSAKGSSAILQAAKNLPGGGAVHTLFNTHWHPEQTGSNETLGKAGATIIAQENTRLWLTQDITWPWNGRKFHKLPEVARPNKTFYDYGVLPSGIHYGWVSDAPHTDGDLYVYFPEQNVMAVGNAAYGKGWPVVDWWTGGWIGGIVGGLQRIQSIGNEETKFIPADGSALSYADITEQVDMYGNLYDTLNRMLNKGRSPAEAVEEGVGMEYEAKMGDPSEFVTRSFESLWAYLSPDA